MYIMGGIILIDGIEVSIGSHEGKTVVIGSDHRGFDYKKAIAEMLQSSGYHVLDIGTFSPERCDYPRISHNLGKQVSEDPHKVGIGICGSGIGILIPASKYQGIYVARCVTPQEATTSRKHNNTNVLGLGADYVTLETALFIVGNWMTTPFYSDESEKAYLERYVQTVQLEKEMRQV